MAFNSGQVNKSQVDKILNGFNHKCNQVKLDIDIKLKELIQSTIKDINDFVLTFEEQNDVSKK
ncbi:MAG: hypothetical protein MJ252_31170 [archaeon]|nr:hypothetical protein [archaeon]